MANRFKRRALSCTPSHRDWHVLGIDDFNGDFNCDLLWRQDGTGQVYVWEMNGQQVQAEGAVAHAPVTTDWQVQGVGDFNGDGDSDVLWRQDGSGQTYIWEMNGNRFKRRALSRTPHSPPIGTSRASAISTAMATATFSGVRTAAARSMSGR